MRGEGRVPACFSRARVYGGPMSLPTADVMLPPPLGCVTHVVAEVSRCAVQGS